MCYGLGQNIGDVDFYPNGGNSQPGCFRRKYTGKLEHIYAENPFFNPFKVLTYGVLYFVRYNETNMASD